MTCLKFIFLIKTNYLIQPRITALVIWLAKRMANQMTPNYGANIWNEYIFLLKCNLARIWTQNVYFRIYSTLHCAQFLHPTKLQSKKGVHGIKNVSTLLISLDFYQRASHSSLLVGSIYAREDSWNQSKPSLHHKQSSALSNVANYLLKSISIFYLIYSMDCCFWF